MKTLKEKRAKKLLLECDMYKEMVEHHIECCEGKHIQQVVYSTFHKALTQICFTCGKIRTSLRIEDIEK